MPRRVSLQGVLLLEWSVRFGAAPGSKSTHPAAMPAPKPHTPQHPYGRGLTGVLESDSPAIN